MPSRGKEREGGERAEAPVGGAGGVGAQPEELRAAQDRFVAVWGQMAGAWGISRTMAEVHALLYITGAELNSDEIMERLQISRGNASMSLRGLLEWGIVTRTTRRGDRKEYFRAEQDVWALFRSIVRERMAREVEPLRASLHEIRDMTGPRGPRERAARPSGEKDLARAVQEHRERIDAMIEFFEIVEALSQRFVTPQGKGLRLAATLLAKAPEFLMPSGGGATPAPRKARPEGGAA